MYLTSLANSVKAVGVAAVMTVVALSPARAEDYLDTFTFQQAYLRRCIDSLRQVRESFIARNVMIAGTGSAASESLWVTGCGNASDVIYNQLDQPSLRDEIEEQIRELGPSGFIEQTKAQLRSEIDERQIAETLSKKEVSNEDLRDLRVAYGMEALVRAAMEIVIDKASLPDSPDAE